MVQHTGSPVHITRRINRVLLYYLAARGAAVSRDALAELFWPGESLKKARANLREALSRLRTALPEPGLLVSLPESISLDFRKIQVDLLVFNDLAHQIGGAPWRVAAQTPLQASMYAEILKLVHLYRLPGLLATSDFKGMEQLALWQEDQANTARMIALRYLDRAYEHSQATNSPEEALHLARLGVQIDPLDETRQVRLLSGLINMGMRRQAREHFERLEKYYSRELRSELPADLEELRPQLQGETRRSRKAEHWGVHATLQTPFVGRERFLQRLQKGFATAGSVVILGEAGSGKTRLVQEFFKQHTGNPRLLLGVCRPLESTLPFQPWLDMIRRSVAPMEWLLLPQQWAVPLEVVLPEIRAARKLPSRSVQGEQTRPAIFEAIHRLLDIMARQRPLFVFLDDAHWADESSLDLVGYLIRQDFFRASENFLVLSARIESSNEALNRLMINLGENQLDRIRLEPLNDREVAELVQFALHRQAPEVFVQQVTRVSGGNPYITLEILQPFLEMGSLPPLDELTDLPLTGGIQQLIGTRLQMIPSNARDVLQAAAVAGSQFKSTLLEKMISLSPAEVAAALNILENARFIARLEEGYVFIHEKVRELMLFGLPPATNTLLHRNMAQALEEEHASYLDPQAARIAEIYEKANLFEKAFHFWVLAARYAYGLYSVKEALDACERAMQVVPRASSLTDEAYYSLYRIWNRIAYETADLPNMVRINQWLYHLGRDRNSDLLLGAGLVGMGSLAFAENKFQRSISFIEQAIPHLERIRFRPELLRAIRDRGVMEYMSGNFLSAQNWFRRGLTMTIETTQREELEMRAGLNYHMSVTEALLGHPNSAMEFAVQSLREFKSVNAIYGAASAYSSLAMIHYMVGRFREGLLAAEDGLELMSHLGESRIAGYLHHYACLSALNLGNLSKAWQYAARTVENGNRNRHNDIISLGTKAIGDIYFHLHDMPAALQYYQQAYAIAGESFVAINALSQLGLVTVYLNRPGGREMINQAREICDHNQLYAFRYFADQASLRAMLHQREFESFDVIANGMASQLRTLYGIQDSPTISRYRAERALRQEKFEEALERTDNLLPYFRSLQAIWPCIRVLLLRQACLLALRREEEALREENDLRKYLSQLKSSLSDVPDLQTAFETFVASLKDESGIRT